jgi:hypothetical protein
MVRQKLRYDAKMKEADLLKAGSVGQLYRNITVSREIIRHMVERMIVSRKFV